MFLGTLIKKYSQCTKENILVYLGDVKEDIVFLAKLELKHVIIASKDISFLINSKLYYGMSSLRLNDESESSIENMLSGIYRDKNVILFKNFKELSKISIKLLN